MAGFATLANASGLIVEVDLIGARGNGLPNSDRYPVWTKDHAPAFWQSVCDRIQEQSIGDLHMINEPTSRRGPAIVTAAAARRALANLEGGRWWERSRCSITIRAAAPRTS